MNLEEQKQAGYFNKDRKCLVREKCGELIRLSVLASILSFDWFLNYWPIKVKSVCFSTCRKLGVCLLIHSRVQGSMAFPQSACRATQQTLCLSPVGRAAQREARSADCFRWEKTALKSEMLACGMNISQFSLWVHLVLFCVICCL